MSVKLSSTLVEILNIFKVDKRAQRESVRMHGSWWSNESASLNFHQLFGLSLSFDLSLSRTVILKIGNKGVSLTKKFSNES